MLMMSKADRDEYARLRRAALSAVDPERRARYKRLAEKWQRTYNRNPNRKS